MNNIGKITQIIGPVVDIQFSEKPLPTIYNAVEISFEKSKKVVADVFY